MSAILYYVFTLAVYFASNALMVLGLNLQFGLAGVINFSYYMLVAAGGYAAALAAIGPMTSADFGAVTYIGGWSLPWPVPVVAAGLVGAVVAVAVGYLAVRRLRSDYLAIATLVVGEGAWMMTGNSTGFLNGWMGLSNIPQPAVGAFGLPPLLYEGFFGLICLVAAAGGFWLTERLSRSPFGRALRAVRENETTAAACGKDVFSLRLKTMAVGGLVAAVGGALFVEFIGTVAPGMWAVPETFVLFTALIVGGTGNNWGAVLGAALVPVGFLEATRFVPDIGGNADVVATLRWVVIGLLGMFILYFRPEGILPEPKAKFPSAGPAILPSKGQTAASVAGKS